MEWSGERGAESSSTGFCKCGWSESAGGQREVRNEYRHHLAQVQRRRDEGKPDPAFEVTMDSPWHPDNGGA
jgi:hypothetical protein